MKYYCISDHCRWVKGSNGSAIYDLQHGQVYSLNPDGTRLLSMALLGEPLPDDISFLDSLEKDGLLNDHSCIIVEHKIKPHIRYAWLELTNRCNCRCLHCYGAFGLPCESELASELSTDEWRKALEQLKSFGCEAIQLIGGEPLLHPGFSELLRYASDLGLKRIDIFTNAYLITEQIADLIAEVGASVRISLYGFDAQSHDSITQHPGSFARLDHSLDLLLERNIKVGLAVVLMQENQHILPQISAYIENKGLRFSGFDTVRTVRHSPQNSHAVTDPEINQQRIMCGPKFTTSDYSFAVNHQWNSCWYGKFSITAQGDIIPCIFARDLLCGNIRMDDWNSIREKLLSYWRITKDQVEVCQDCEYRYACDDCRPLAMGDGDGLYGKYPRCVYHPDQCKWEKSEAGM